VDALSPVLAEQTTISEGEKLAGRVALVTGGTRGIGAAICRSLASQGASVAAGYSAHREGAERFLKEFERDFAGPGRATLHQGNVSSPEDCRRVVHEVLDQHGRLDILVNNAGVFETGLIENTTRASFDRMIAVNQIGCFLGMKTAAPAMRSVGGGAIVNVASAAGLLGNPGLFAYTATKWAIRGMTKTAAGELGRDGIRVNAVLPGSVDTDMVRSQAAEGREAFFQSLPVPRQGNVDDIAEMICFLASEQSAYCTGADFVVDGGLTASRSNPPRRDPS
jgi:NAD(P)-dependent dehydrogenase (short-subunit alcohol dehydrogenase family)